MAKQFGSGAAFKSALEARLRKRAEERGVPFATLQLKFVIERLLARLFCNDSPSWLLKGGFAMELRFRPRARTTKDVDLSVPLVSEETKFSAIAMREKLQNAADIDLNDHLIFRIGEPKKELTNAPQGGARYPCEAVFVGKIYGKLHIDVGVGDIAWSLPEKLSGDDLLDFAGIAPAIAFAIPIAQQFAEKLHTYTFPWVGRTNTRTKDLVDMVLLIERGTPDVEKIREALHVTFESRGTHPLPHELAPPPTSWERDFVGMAEEAKLSTADYLAAFEILKRFWSAFGFGAGS